MLVIIFYPSIKTDVLDAQKNHLIETVLLSIYNMFWLKNKNHFQVCTLIWKVGQKFEGRSSLIFVKPELGQTVWNTSIGKEF